MDQCTPNNTYHIVASVAERYLYTNGQVIITTVVLPLILCIGIITNTAFFYVTVRIEHMRTVTNMYLINLAIADVVFLAAAIGDKLWKYSSSPMMGDNSMLGLVGCIWVYFLSDMAYFASLIFVTLVSLDRYIAVCRPMDRQNTLRTTPMIYIIGSWFSACVLGAFMIPASANFKTYCFMWPNDVKTYRNWPIIIGFCGPINEWIGIMDVGIQTIPFVVALFLNLYLYVAIIRTLSQWIKRMGTAKAKDVTMSRQIARMLVVNGTVFFCLLAPFELLLLIRTIALLERDGNYYLSDNTTRSILTILVRILSYMNSAINPVIYTVMCRRYLDAFKEALLPKSFMLNKTKEMAKKASNDKDKIRMADHS